MNAVTKNPMTFVMLAIFVVMVAIATTYPAGARFMPFVVGIPAIMLCLLQIVLDLRAGKQAEGPKDHRSEMEIAQERMSRMTGRQMTFEAVNIAPEITVSENPTGIAESREFIIWIYVLFLRWEAKCSWLKAALYSGIGSSALMFIFTYVLKFQLHKGFITERVMDFLG
jgi:hypothetical protein